MDINNNTSKFINSIIEDNTINLLIDSFNKRHNEILTTITKYEAKQAELQKGLKINELVTNSFIADVNLNHSELYNLQIYATDVADLINLMNMKTNKLKQLIIHESKEVIQQLSKFKEKQKQIKPFQMQSLSFNVNANEMTFDSQTQPSIELTNSTIRNFIPDINSTNTPVNDTDLLPANSSAMAQATLNPSDVSQAPASPNNRQTIQDVTTRTSIDINTEHESGENECETVAENLKPAERLKTTKNMNNKKLECEICKKFYLNQKSLSTHKSLYHTKQRSFECEICDRKFNQKITLRIHKNTHNTNRPKPFKCQQCDYATDVKHNFSKHQANHERQNKKFASMKNPIKCEKCPKYCKDKNALYVHMNVVHPKVLHQCDSCGKYLKAKASLKRHILRHMKK